jgi:hypothetical protein
MLRNLIKRILKFFNSVWYGDDPFGSTVVNPPIEVTKPQPSTLTRSDLYVRTLGMASIDWKETKGES